MAIRSFKRPASNARYIHATNILTILLTRSKTSARGGGRPRPLLSRQVVHTLAAKITAEQKPLNHRTTERVCVHTIVRCLVHMIPRL